MGTSRTPEQRRQGEIPDTMRAAAIDRFGPPEVLAIHTLPVPIPGEDDVLIEAHTAGVGVWDAKIRDGSWAEENVRFPYVLGTDGSGVIVAKGKSVRRFAVGDRVWAYEYANPYGGFYAEYVAIAADSVGHIPQDLDLLQAGAGAVTSLTAMQGIEDHLQVRSQETVLIYGATGAVGTLAIQFAKHRHAFVIATATGDDARKLAMHLGANETIDARNSEAPQALAALAPNGLQAALVLASGSTLEGCLDQLHHNGRVAYPHGVEPEPGKRPGIRIKGYDAVSNPNEWERLQRLAHETKLTVPVAARYPLAEAAKAHERLEKGHVLGRIALSIRRGE